MNNDSKQLAERNITQEQVERQVAQLKRGTAFVKLMRPATIGDGIIRMSPNQISEMAQAYDEDKEQLTIAAVTGNDGEELKADDFVLQVQSINDPQCYWLDSGEFNLNIATTDLNNA